MFAAAHVSARLAVAVWQVALQRGAHVADFGFKQVSAFAARRHTLVALVAVLGGAEEAVPLFRFEVPDAGHYFSILSV